MHETILVLDFGGQYNQLIARRVREQNVYAEVKPYTTPLAEIQKQHYKGIIFTGGPNSVYDPAPRTMSGRFYPSACRCLASAMARSSSLGWRAGRLRPRRMGANTARWRYPPCG